MEKTEETGICAVCGKPSIATLSADGEGPMEVCQQCLYHLLGFDCDE